MHKTILAILAMTAAVPAEAGLRAVYDQAAEKRTITFEIDDEGNFRAGREGQYRIVTETEVYQVAEMDGQFYVARIEDLAGALKDTSPGLLRAAAKAATFLAGQEPTRWERRSKRTINGIPGREYVEVAHWINDSFDPFEDMDANRVVISDDPALAALGRAVLHYTADELYLKRHFISGITKDAVLRSLDDLAELGTVIASSEGDLELVEAGEAEIDPGRLRLPAEPMSREAIVALIRAKRNPFKL